MTAPSPPAGPGPYPPSWPDTLATGPNDWHDPPTEPALLPVPPQAAHPGPGRLGLLGLLGVFGLGALVAVGLGVYGRLHAPTFFSVSVAGFSSGTAAKVWLATAAGLLALLQLGSALVMYGRFPQITAPSWVGALHRWSGRLAVLVSVPVAVHCLFALGLQTGSPRVLVHSLAGCFFYGVFVTKMLILTSCRGPRWTLPVLGGALFTALVALWVTSAGWFFATSGITL